jgi:hypothetical protein
MSATSEHQTSAAEAPRLADMRERESKPAGQPEAKPTGPFDAAAKVVRAVQLSGIHFSSCSAHALDAADTITNDVDLAASTRFLRPIVARSDEGFSTKTTLLFQLGGKSTDAEQPSTTTPYAVIRATIEASYRLKPDAPRFSDDEVKDYALCYCPFHVWGYWREFVQSSLARLDLPQLTVPLFLISQAPQMVQDSLD